MINIAAIVLVTKLFNDLLTNSLFPSCIFFNSIIIELIINMSGTDIVIILINILTILKIDKIVELLHILRIILLHHLNYIKNIIIILVVIKK